MIASHSQKRIILPPLRREHVAALIGFAIPALFFFREAVFHGRMLFRRDLNMVWLPQVEVFVKSVAQGAWPLWDRYSGFGRPLLADPRAEVFYPITWLNLILGPAAYLAFFAVFHLLLSGMGQYRLARRLGLPPLSAYLSGAIWICSGPFLSLFSQWHHFAAAAWIPWIFLAADMGVSMGRWRDILVWAGVMSLHVFAGSPDLTILILPALAVFMAARMARRAEGVPWPRALRVTAIGAALTVALTAAQWMPTLEWMRRTSRSETTSQGQADWSLHPMALAEIALPVSPADLPLTPAVQARLLAGKEPWLHSIHLGLPALLLVIAGVASRRRLRVLFALALLASALYACGPHTPANALANRLFPPLQLFRFPVKSMVVAAFFWSNLAGFGHALFCDKTRPSARAGIQIIRLCAAIALAAALAGAWLTAFSPQSWRILVTDAAFVQRFLLPRLIIAAVLSGLMICLTLPRTDAARLWSCALIVLCLGPLLHFHRNLHVTAPRDLFAARPPALPVIRGVPQPRLYTRSYYFEPARKSPPVDASVYRVTRRAAGLSGYESLILGVHRYLNPPTAARWSVSGSYDWDILGFDTREFSALTARLEAAEGTADHVKLLRIGGVTHALALAPEPWWSGLVPLATYPSVFRDDMHLFKVPATLPRAYAVGGARAADGEAALRALTAETFDPRREIVLSGDASAAPTDPPGSVRVIEIGPDRARLEADLDRPGFIVLLEAYDPGWRATIDGRAAALLRANTIFRAVPAPAGHHIVECVYRPRAVMIGGAVSLTTVLLIGLFGALMARARRPASTRVNESMR